MLFPYQIGDVPLFKYLVGSDDPIQLELEQSWDVPSTRFSTSGGTIYQGPLNRSLAQSVNYKLTGIVQAKSTSLAQELKSRLKALGGRLAIPIICFRYEDPYEAGEQTQIDWLVADGVITENSDNYAYAGLDLSVSGHVRLRLDISITLMQPFQRLFPWFWEYRPFMDRNQNPYSPQGSASLNNRFIHPKVFSEIQDEFYFLRWMNRETLLDPLFWEVSYYQDFAGQGMEFSENYELFYFSESALWSSPPKVVYAFRKMLPYGSVSIEVDRSTGSWLGDEYKETSSIDLVALDETMAENGYGGLFLSDTLYVGAIYPFPSYIVRNGTILTGFTPDWTYSGLFPGEVQNGPARIRFIPYLTSLEVAYNLNYGAVG